MSRDRGIIILKDPHEHHHHETTDEAFHDVTLIYGSNCGLFVFISLSSLQDLLDVTPTKMLQKQSVHQRLMSGGKHSKKSCFFVSILFIPK